MFQTTKKFGNWQLTVLLILNSSYLIIFAQSVIHCNVAVSLSRLHIDDSLDNCLPYYHAYQKGNCFFAHVLSELCAANDTTNFWLPSTKDVQKRPVFICMSFAVCQNISSGVYRKSHTWIFFSNRFHKS